MVGNEIADVECRRDSPLRRYNDVVCVGVDYAANCKRSRRAGVELVGFLHLVAFRSEAYHHHVSDLILEILASCINRSFDLGIVGGDPFLRLVVYLCEVGGVIDGFRGGGFWPGEGHKVDRQVWVTPCVNLEGRIPHGAVAGGVVGDFCARQEFVPRGCIFLDEIAQKVAQ